MLYKHPGSGNGGCPSVWLDENGEFVFQGPQADTETMSALSNMLPGETAVRLSADVVLGAIDRFRSHGH